MEFVVGKCAIVWKCIEALWSAIGQFTNWNIKYYRLFVTKSLPIIKKFPGSVFSLILLYVKSNISMTGNAPKPLGNPYSLLIETLNILNLGSEDKLTGRSSIWLLARLSISKFIKLAKAAGTTWILLWLSDSRVMLAKLTVTIQCFVSMVLVHTCFGGHSKRII